MSRRAILLVILALGCHAAPLPADAQAPGKVARIGVLRTGSPPDPNVEGFRQGLREIGYVEGQNIVVEYRWAEGRPDRLPDLAADLVHLKVDVIVTGGLQATRAAREATSTIPIVTAASGDPVGSGFVASLRRAGGNVTGLTNIAPELSGKRLELLKEVVPRVSRVAMLGNPKNPTYEFIAKEMRIAARALRVQLQGVEVVSPAEFEGAFAVMRKAQVGALVLAADEMFFAHRRRIAELATKNRLPGVFDSRGFVEAGGLMAYGPSLPEIFRRAATYVDKILKGAKPADLPVEQPMRFKLVINLKTARALGLTIPQTIMIRADQVIQ